MKTSFYLALLIIFVDSMGIGLIYPVFSALFFDSSASLLPPTTTSAVRGLWLSLHLSLMPLALFFSAPVWGALSDSQGRKKPLQISLVIGLSGYITALCGLLFNSIAFLLFSRILIGCSSGNTSVAQAAIADLSTAKTKVKNFGLCGMALGMGFALGPFFGAMFSAWSYSSPFYFASFLLLLTFILTHFYFGETLQDVVPKKLNWTIGLIQLKKAFYFRGVRTIFTASFLHNFAWCYFYQFIPIYLMEQLRFSPTHVGCFYGIAGGMYALSTGLLIRPLIRRFQPETLFFSGNFLASLGIGAIALLSSSLGIWPLIILICYFIAFVAPTSTTLVSNSATAQTQGEVLSILTSVNSIAPIFSPLFSGSLVGTYPLLPIWVGAGIMLLAALILLAIYRGRLFTLP